MTQSIEGEIKNDGYRIQIIASKFNNGITERLVKGAVEAT